MAVGCGRCAVTEAREWHPGLHLVGCGIDDGELRLGLVSGEDHGVVRRDGDALRAGRDGNDGECLARLHVEYGDCAGTDVGGVSARAVAREREHVGLLLAGGDAADDLEGLGVDDADGLVELGGDVEHAAVAVVDGAVGADSVAEVDGVGDLAAGEVDD